MLAWASIIFYGLPKISSQKSSIYNPSPWPCLLNKLEQNQYLGVPRLKAKRFLSQHDGYSQEGYLTVVLPEILTKHVEATRLFLKSKA